MADQDWFSQNAPKSAAAPAASGGDWFAQNGQQTTAAQPASFIDSALNFAKNFAHNVDPRPALKLLYDAAQAGPGGNNAQPIVDDLKGLGHAQIDQFTKAKQAYRDGRISEAVGHTLAGALPLVGPAAANAGEQIGSGDVSGGLGAAAGLLAPMGAAEAIPKVIPKSVRVTPAITAKTAELGDAVRFGERHSIPIDAATATGSELVKSVQKKVSDSMGGAATAERFKAQQSSRLATVGEQLAAKANSAEMVGPLQPGEARPTVPGMARTPEQAGTLAQNGVRNVVHDQHVAATAQYEKLRAIENQPQNQRMVTMAGPDGDVQVPMALPVDLRGTKSALTDVYTRLKQEGDVAPLMGSKAEAARILNRIVTGPDYAPLSAVDGALGELKSFIRADNPDLLSAGQANVAEAVSKLDADVQAAARSAGPDAVRALNQGRTATKAKYIAADVLKGLETGTGEPVAAYNRLTARGDSAIGQLRDVARQAPDAVPQIGRAIMDGLMDQATADGGFQHAQAVRTKWNKLGPETKTLLFKDPAYISDVDHFLRLAEKIAENPNPSGTARINNLFNMASAAVGYPASRLLYTRAGVRLLTEGYRIPLQSATAVAHYTARLTAALKEQARLNPVPATADGSQPDSGSPIARQ